jgi:heme/copper-type cytochrome/quinol oxidase subunit 2
MCGLRGRATGGACEALRIAKLLAKKEGAMALADPKAQVAHAVKDRTMILLITMLGAIFVTAGVVYSLDKYGRASEFENGAFEVRGERPEVRGG